jgi:hypothetical protein
MKFKRRKKSGRPRRLSRSLAMLALAAGAGRAGAQSYYDFLQPSEPTLTMPQLKYLQTDVELDKNSYTPKSGGGATTSTSTYVASGVGIGWNYFLYHPDLMTFSILAEPGYNWQANNDGSTTTHDNSLLLNGNFDGSLLQLKPYATTVNYNRSHEQYNYDFFNSATVDAQRWGVISGYREGPVPSVVTFSQSHVDSSGINYDSTSDQTTAGFQAQNLRHGDDLTDLNYQFNQFNNTSSGGGQNYTDSSSSQSLTINDNEHYTTSALNSSLFYEHIEGEGAPSDNVNLMLEYSIQHTPHLRSFFGYSLSDYSSSGNNSLANSVRAGLNHQFYDSLNSMISVNGGNTSSDSSGSTLDQNTVGTSASVDYEKRLANWGHLSLSDTAGYQYTQQTSTGDQQFIANEVHTVQPPFLFYLDQPQEITWVSLTDSTGAITYVQGADYDVITTSNPWQIRIYTTGPNHIVAGQVVKANYFCQPNPNGSYSTINNGAQIRLDFWNNHAGIFARYNSSDNQASSPGFVLDSENEFQAGGDLNWKRLRLTGTYTDRTSTFYDYQSIVTSESYTVLATGKNSAGLNFNQSWSTYPNNGGGGTNGAQNISYYSWTGHYDWHPFSGFDWSSEAGLEQQHGGGTDQNFITARTSLGWTVGKLEVRLGYEYENQDYNSEIRERNFAYLRLRRNF